VKVVFDSNIFISAFVVPRGQAEKAILKVIEENVTLILSKEIMGEVLKVLSAKFKRDKEALSRTAVYLSDLATIVKSSKKLKVLKDEPDNRILECAVAGGADLIVTGDKALLRLKEFEGIQIVSLKEFLEFGSS
jgi:putative PIN family toxin of toxin-antitoxin system